MHITYKLHTVNIYFTWFLSTWNLNKFHVFTTPYHSVNDCLEIRPPISPVSSCTVLDTSSRIPAHHLCYSKTPLFGTGGFVVGNFPQSPLIWFLHLAAAENFGHLVHHLQACIEFGQSPAGKQLIITYSRNDAQMADVIAQFWCRNHGASSAKIWSIYEWIGWILLINMPNVLLVSLHDDSYGHGPSMILWMWDFFELDMYRNCIGPPCGTTRLHMKTPTCFSKYFLYMNDSYQTMRLTYNYIHNHTYVFK